MHVIQNIAKWVFILCLPVMLLTASVTWAANSGWLYRYGFDKYEVDETTGLDKSGLDEAADGLISYFNSDDEFIDITVMKDGKPFQLFNEREIGHLKDVKALFRLVYRLLLVTFVYCLAYLGVTIFWWKDGRRLARGLLYGGGLTLVLMAAIGVIVLVDFDWFFYRFHLLSFANDLWMLNPATDYLIMLFPQGFWYDAALFCALATAIGALVLGGVGWWRLRKAGMRDY
jgi:integral membrane protein (TIGR01906 family)